MIEFKIDLPDGGCERERHCGHVVAAVLRGWDEELSRWAGPVFAQLRVGPPPP
jgi:hypothetical protein